MAFIVFAAATAVFNALTDRMAIVFMADGVFMLAGIFILAKKGAPRKRIELAARIYDRLNKRPSGNSIKDA